MPFPINRVTPAPVPPQARQYRVRVRDGVRLATDVYLPAPVGRGEQDLPTVLIRLPYDKNSRYVFADRIAERFTAHGYAVAVQDVRGKFRSEGVTLPFVHESADGYDTIEWITCQSWSNGRVGMFGDSYYGNTQWAAVAAQHPALRAIVPRVTAADFNALFRNGGRELPPPVWREGVGYFAQYWVGPDTYEYEPDPAQRPAIDQYEEAFAAIGARSAWFSLLAPNRVDLCTQFGRHPFDARPVPVLHCLGWYDNIGHAHMRDYLELAARPEWDAVQYLWAGAFDHENYQLESAPVAAEDDHATNEAALARMLDGYLAPAVAFLDVFLKGTEPVSSLPKVAWELGHAGWRTAETWPPPLSRPISFRLVDASAATGPLPGGGLVVDDGAAVGEPDEAAWVHGPQAPVPSLVDNSFAYLQTHPDLAPLAERADVLSFATAPLAEPLDLAGPVSAELQVTSTAPVFDLFAKLADLAPDGTARLIVRGQIQAGDQATGPLHVDLSHTGYRVRAGHRLALLVSSSDFPMFLPAPGTGENPWTATVVKPTTQRLATGGDQPSRLTVTALPTATG
ncbi:CocE/NonD family hydrolase [Streptomyces griseomycini]|uniref:CocE/NonD family hydrolase n=1 Tax=Streptomyces griseomycini TaxID=66895 RepID=UPI0034208001